MTTGPLQPLASSLRAEYEAVSAALSGPPFNAYESGKYAAFLQAINMAAPFDAELARLRAENLELRRVGAVLYECALRKEPRDMEAAIEACLAWERLQEAAP